MPAYRYAVLLMSPLMMVRARVLVPPLESDGSRWLSIGLAACAVYAVAALIFLERQLTRGPAAARLRSKGRNPERDMALLGVVMMLAPASAAFLCSLFGVSLVQLIGYAAFSIVGVALWGWRYRRVIGSSPQ